MAHAAAGAAIVPFRPPDAAILKPLLQSFPGRDHQIQSLAKLLFPESVPGRNVVLHGTEATGKSSVSEQLLQRISAHFAQDQQSGGFSFAIVNAQQCITARHLFERVVGAVAEALQWREIPQRCETLSQLVVLLSEMLKEPIRDPRWRFVLVLDAIDRQRDAPQTMLPALGRLSEMISSLTTVFIVTAPPANLLRSTSSTHIYFPPYTKQEFVRILSLSPPPALPGTTDNETAELWTRFCAATHDALIRSASRTLPSSQHSCHALWPRFVAPILAGTHLPKEFSKLLIASRVHFQDESLLNPSLVSARPQERSGTTASALAHISTSMADLTALLPTVARLLLLAGYVASHNATRHDLSLFSTYYHGRKRRRGGGFASSRGTLRTKHRKIARKLLGANTFALERMLAIFEAARSEWVSSRTIGSAGLDGDVGTAIATLGSLRLLTRVGAGDTMDRSGKWRLNVGWDAIRAVGRSIGVEVEEWLVE